MDTQKHEHSLSVLECTDIRPKGEGEQKTTKFKWVSNVLLKRNNIVALAKQGGRLGWIIEDEGFNVQK